MNKRKWSKSVLLFAVFTFTLVGFQQFAFCTSGGGGDGEERDQFSNLASFQGAGITKISELSHEELVALMTGLSAENRSVLLDTKFPWRKDATVKELIDLIDKYVPVSVLTDKERDSLLANLDQRTREWFTKGFEYWTEGLSVAELKDAIKKVADMPSREAAGAEASYHLVSYIDEKGEFVQTILGYCPGVGLATSVILDTVRAGANARKEGKDTSEIAEAAAVKGTISFVFNYYSKADEILDTATEGATEMVGQLVAYLGTKEAEAQAGSVLEKSANITATDIENMEIAATFASDLMAGMPTRENKVTRPTHTSPTGYGPGQTHQTQHTAQ